MPGSRNRLVLFAFAVLTLAFVDSTARAQQGGFSIIDTHTHLIPGRGLEFRKAIESAIEQMDRHGIATSILMPPPRSTLIKQNYDQQDFRALLKNYPGRFLFMGGGGSLNVMLHQNRDPAKVSKETRKVFADEARKIAASGVVGFGEISSLHISLASKHAYSFVPADHPLLKILADVAAHQGLPIDLHMDALAKPTRPSSRLARLPNNPERFPETLSALDRLLSHNAKARIIWAHAGTDHLGDFSPKVVRGLMNKHDNLYVSLKVAGPKAGTRNRLFSPGKVHGEWLSLFKRYPDRFLIGSDAFYSDPAARGPGRQFAKSSENRLRATRKFLSLLPKPLTAKIARDNAVKLYGLSSTQVPRIVLQERGRTQPKRRSARKGGLCRDGNLAHCRIVCKHGNQRACSRLKRSR